MQIRNTQRDCKRLECKLLRMINTNKQTNAVTCTNHDEKNDENGTRETLGRFLRQRVTHSTRKDDAQHNALDGIAHREQSCCRVLLPGV